MKLRTQMAVLKYQLLIQPYVLWYLGALWTNPGVRYCNDQHELQPLVKAVISFYNKIFQFSY